LSGGTLSGNLFLNADPTNPTQAVTKRYVDQSTAAGYLPITGGTVTGPVYAPTLGIDVNNVWTTPAIVAPGLVWSIRDGNGNIAIAIDVTGMLLVGGVASPTSGTQPVPLSYVQATFLPLTGGTLAGDLFLNADPTTPTQAATKAYVDVRVGSSGGPFLPMAGGTATGPVYAPVLGMDANNTWSGASFEPGY